MRDDDTRVENLCSLHSAVGLSQISSALGPGTSNKTFFLDRYKIFFLDRDQV